MHFSPELLIIWILDGIIIHMGYSRVIAMSIADIFAVVVQYEFPLC